MTPYPPEGEFYIVMPLKGIRLKTFERHFFSCNYYIKDSPLGGWGVRRTLSLLPLSLKEGG